jgi:hypothetical protein
MCGRDLEEIFIVGEFVGSVVVSSSSWPGRILLAVAPIVVGGTAITVGSTVCAATIVDGVVLTRSAVIMSNVHLKDPTTGLAAILGRSSSARSPDSDLSNFPRRRRISTSDRDAPMVITCITLIIIFLVAANRAGDHLFFLVLDSCCWCRPFRIHSSWSVGR